MPRLPMDYSTAVIYKICCKDLSITECYVGSTTNLYNRKSQHKGACNNVKSKKHNINVYQFIRANYGWYNWSVIVVEEFPCDSKIQLETRERYHMESLKATLNRAVPTRSTKEYYKDNVERLKEQHKKYYENNSEKMKEVGKKWRENNVEKVKEATKKWASEKIQCLHCDEIIGRHSMKRHIRRKHQ